MYQVHVPLSLLHSLIWKKEAKSKGFKKSVKVSWIFTGDRFSASHTEIRRDGGAGWHDSSAWQTPVGTKQWAHICTGHWGKIAGSTVLVGLKASCEKGASAKSRGYCCQLSRAMSWGQPLFWKIHCVGDKELLRVSFITEAWGADDHLLCPVPPCSTQNEEWLGALGSLFMTCGRCFGTATPWRQCRGRKGTSGCHSTSVHPFCRHQLVKPTEEGRGL